MAFATVTIAAMRRLRTFMLVLGWLALGVVLVLTGIGALYTPNTEIPAGVTGHHVTVAGVPLRVLQRGNGPDVLLIHGSPGCIEDWLPLIDVLSRDARVTAYDRPGHGYSGDTGQYSYTHNADVALALIAELGLRRVTVAGHSYGGTRLRGAAHAVVLDAEDRARARQGMARRGRVARGAEHALSEHSQAAAHHRPSGGCV